MNPGEEPQCKIFLRYIPLLFGICTSLHCGTNYKLQCICLTGICFAFLKPFFPFCLSSFWFSHSVLLATKACICCVSFYLVKHFAVGGTSEKLLCWRCGLVWITLDDEFFSNGANDSSLLLQCLCCEVGVVEVFSESFCDLCTSYWYCFVLFSGMWKQLSPLDIFIVGYGVRGSCFPVNF